MSMKTFDCILRHLWFRVFVFDEIFIPSTENELCKDNQGSLKYLN